ncbi:universal stress protein [Virgisporangium ochraceum]
MEASVIVGVDGSPSAAHAAELAGELAVRHRLALEVVHVFSWPAMYPPFLPPSVVKGLDPRPLAAEIVGTVATAVGQRHPYLSIGTRAVDGNAAGVLVDASRHAAFLVVGHRGLGGLTEIVVGSVGVYVAAHAHCPVLVVRGDAGPSGAPVVVGVDGSTPARTAAAHVFAEADSRHADLYVVHARVGGSTGDPVDLDLADLVGRYPDVKVHREVRTDDPPAVVISRLASDVGAGLVVVGSRGLGGFRSLLVGGTSRMLVDHAPCPVMVVPTNAVTRLQGGTS